MFAEQAEGASVWCRGAAMVGGPQPRTHKHHDRAQHPQAVQRGTL